MFERYDLNKEQKMENGEKIANRSYSSLDKVPKNEPPNHINLSDVSIEEFNEVRGSPYSRRYPHAERCERSNSYYEKIDFGGFNQRLNKAGPSNPDWTPSSSEDGDNQYLNDIALPVQIQRRPSMQSLRHRRDQHFQGHRQRRPKRILDKDGAQNIELLNLPQHTYRFFKDFVTTLMDQQWRHLIIIFILSYVICWLVFATLWYLVAYAHGDFLIDKVSGERLGDGSQPCVVGAKSFSAFLLLSIETQVTIGFGTRYPTEECPEAIFLMVVQTVVGVAIEGAMIGIVYAKMVRPPKTTGFQFSRKALICQRDGKLCLLFRICDIQQDHIIMSKVNVHLFEQRHSYEGEGLQQEQKNLRVDNDGRLFVFWPMTVCHVIDALSPLYDFSAKDLLEKRLEIIVTVIGSSRSTGKVTQAKASYLPKEILWGHRFVNAVTYNKIEEKFIVDNSKFDEIEAFDTPLCSARLLDEVLDGVHSEMLGDEYFSQHINYNDQFIPQNKTLDIDVSNRILNQSTDYQ